jgi:hypothetical protein
MLEEMMPTVALAVQNDDANFQLTDGERKLISNFRAMKRVAQDAMVDLSEQYKRTLPALPVKLTLVCMADSV